MSSTQVLPRNPLFTGWRMDPEASVTMITPSLFFQFTVVKLSRLRPVESIEDAQELIEGALCLTQDQEDATGESMLQIGLL